ncbi:MAG: nucleotidyl transferase AbiEii/AbiGii toxin family protein [bacterium]|nr:nucleotidyl transferase AbiEii/AbiGii toxin family protein [bacterium]
MNWEKSKALTPLKYDFLVSFFKENNDFFLTGGSALGIFYFQHRFSYDLDLFTVINIDWRLLEGLFISRNNSGSGGEPRDWWLYQKD